MKSLSYPSGRPLPSSNSLRFGNGGSPRKEYEDAILKVAERAHQMYDGRAKNVLLNNLVALAHIRTTDRNYRRWAELLNMQANNQLHQIGVCITAIMREAQGV